MALKLKYETGVAATIQFIIISVLNVIDHISSSINQCLHGRGGCALDIVGNIVLFMIITVWFGALWLAGFAAQDRRSRRIAQFLILAEGLVFLYGLYETTRHTSILGTVIGLADLITSAYVAWLAFRLMRAKGGRVRTRRRRHPAPPPPAEL